MEDFLTASNIMGLASIVTITIITIMLKILIGRFFSSVDENLENMKTQINTIKDNLISVNRRCSDLDHAVADSKNLDGFRLEMRDLFLAKPDFMREMSMIVNQIDSIHPKIDQLEDKVEKLRENLVKGQR